MKKNDMSLHLFIILMLLVNMSVPMAFSSTDRIDDYWTVVTESEENLLSTPLALMPDKYSLYRLDLARLRKHLDDVVAGDAENTLVVPCPEGRLINLTIVEQSTMAPELSAEFPEIKTFHAQVPEHPLISGIVGIDAQYFHGMLLMEDGHRMFIDYRKSGNTVYYISYHEGDYSPVDKNRFPQRD